MTIDDVDEPAQALSIGSIFGGPTLRNRAWREPISRLSTKIEQVASAVTSPLNVNIVFQIPGDLVQPDFQGVRTGHFSKRRSLLVVQAVLPEDCPADPMVILKEAAIQAVNEAELWAQRRGVAAGLQPLREIVLSL